MESKSQSIVIRAAGLTRRYGRVPVVKDVSFAVRSGSITGLLGPNGAGKTTTLRMLAGFLPPSSGGAWVQGVDVCEDPVRVRSHIGYLPEDAPLYAEMRVREYLKFRGHLKGLSSSATRERIDVVVEQCDLTERRHSIIRTLSKGLRQRVGLADCLLHEPACLILDEPTLGLDPNQIRHVRLLIKELAKRHTVLISTHILSEVEVLCDQVVILNRGQVAAADSTAGLLRLLQGDEHVVAEIRGSTAADVAAVVEPLADVHDVVVSTKGDLVALSAKGPGDGRVREAIAEVAVSKGWHLRTLRAEPKHLEDVFAALTDPMEAREG